jgi:hypothetical protein
VALRAAKTLVERSLLKMPTRTKRSAFTRRTWSPGDIAKLKQASRKKIPAEKIAKTLGRSEGACRQKAFSLHLSMDSTPSGSFRKRKKAA